MSLEEATTHLLALKGVCTDACDAPTAAFGEVDLDARKTALVAHHVQIHGADSVAAALAAGPFNRLDERHIAEVTRVAKAVADGEDPVTAAGANPDHVALLEAARTAHADHADELAAAYEAFAAATAE